MVQYLSFESFANNGDSASSAIKEVQFYLKFRSFLETRFIGRHPRPAAVVSNSQTHICIQGQFAIQGVIGLFTPGFSILL